ncbi:MAG: hypothetical protein Q9175_000932 [Cornicularia normoerica]
MQHTVNLGRKCPSLLVSSEEDPSLRESNATHDYLINTLEDVLDITDAKEVSLEDRSAALEVYDPTEIEMDDWTPPWARQGQPRWRYFVFKAEDDDVHFAVLGYIADLHGIREVIQRAWDD